MLEWTKEELGEHAKVSARTILRFETGLRQPYERTLRDVVAAFEAAGVLFIPAVEGVHDGAVALRPGVERARRPAEHGDASSDEDGAIQALGPAWDEAEDFDLADAEACAEPAEAEEWDEATKTEQLEFWRGRLERWAALHEVSRQCLLRAMGVERL